MDAAECEVGGAVRPLCFVNAAHARPAGTAAANTHAHVHAHAERYPRTHPTAADSHLRARPPAACLASRGRALRQLSRLRLRLRLGLGGVRRGARRGARRVAVAFAGGRAGLRRPLRRLGRVDSACGAARRNASRPKRALSHAGRGRGSAKQADAVAWQGAEAQTRSVRTVCVTHKEEPLCQVERDDLALGREGA